MCKTQFIADYAVGDDVASLFVLGSAQQGQAKNGPFWKLALRDATGALEAKLWSPQSQMHPSLTAGDIVEVAGRVTSYRDRPEIAIDRLRVLDDGEREDLDLALFMAASARPPAALLADLEALCAETFTHGPWKKLMKSIFADPRVAARIQLAAAAKAMHHAYAGGLLEHTLGVARLCLAAAAEHPDLDRQTLLAGAVCHDLGKLWEMSQGLAVEYTEEGRLIGHIQLVLEFLDPLIRKAGLEDHLAAHLKHLILSHHGQYEFGSPRLPSTAEAFVLHYADNMDAKINQTRSALASLAEGESGWSAFVSGLDRPVFRPLPTPTGPEGAAPRAPRKPRAVTAKIPEDAQPLPGQLSLLGEGL